LSNDGDALAQLNAALWTDGALIYVPENTELKITIEIVHVSTGEKEILASPRHLIVAGKDSSVSIMRKCSSLQLSSRVIVNFHADISLEKFKSAVLSFAE